jgi:hypothetical protein
MGNEQRGKKIAIIGALGYEQHGGGHSITCYSWPQLSKVRGLKDYDYIIVDLTTPEARKLIFNELRNALNLYVIDDLLCHDATIIVIGDPRFDVAGTPFLSAWTGLSFRWDHQSGTTVVLSPRLNKTEYISHLRSWQYSLIDVEIERQQLLGAKTKILSDLLASSATDLELEVEVIARNRYNNALALAIRWIAKDRRQAGIVMRSGPLILLPEVGLDQDQTVLMVLNDFCGVQSSLPEPIWLASYVAPHQGEIDDQIAKLEGDIKSLEVALVSARRQREDARVCLQLLFGSGFGLESAVWKVLRQLGATVREPVGNKKEEDGWITFQDGERTLDAVLEIKSTTKDTFGLDGIRQAVDWRTRSGLRDQKPYKGVFIGVSAIGTEPKNRPDPFSDSWRENAEIQAIVAISAEDLYYAYVLHCDGTLDLGRFWRAVFQTNGVFSLASFMETGQRSES